MSRVLQMLLFATSVLVPSVIAAADDAPAKRKTVRKAGADGVVKVVLVKPNQKPAQNKRIKQVVVVMKNGLVILGVLIKESKESITLLLPTKKKETIARKDIDELREVKPKKPKVKIVAAAAVVAIRQFGGRSTLQGVRDDVDPQDPKERILLLAPGGPIVVELSMTLDGEPFRMARERLVTELLKAADTDGDDKPTWNEAIANPRFGFGRFVYLTRNKAQRDATVKRYDNNGDGVVDVVEARRLIAQLGGGATFRVQMASTGYGRPDVKKILDTNTDGVISKEELAEAPGRLKSHDANDNDLLESTEAGGGVNRYNRFRQLGPRTRTRPVKSAYLLGPAADLVAIFSALEQRYAGPDKKIQSADFRLFPKLVERLDLDKNGTLDAGEMVGFHLLPPHVVLEVNLGKSKNLKTGIRVAAIAKEMGIEKQAGKKFADKLTLELPGLKLSFSSQTATRVFANYSRSAKSLLTRYDTNKNGYIEKEEMKKAAGQNQQRLVQQFNIWDANSDGKVFAKEIEATYKRQMMPQLSAVTAASAIIGPSFFSALDETGDSRLSLREMKNAADRLAAFDKNSDGEIASEEMPAELTVAFSRGGYYGNRGRTVFVNGRRIPARNAKPSKKQGPEWFVRMDKNGDGDLTPREFLGDEDKFEEFDTNGDGFIERKEAVAAAKP